MFTLSLDDFKDLVREKRQQVVESPQSVVLSYFKNPQIEAEVTQEWLRVNASKFVEQMRSYCWETLCRQESALTKLVIREIFDSQAMSSMSPDAIVDNIADRYDYMYVLSQSNTQSRRSRAGKEFETIIQVLLNGAGVPAEAQGYLGVETQKKAVDFVVPSVTHYMVAPQNIAIISVKTTLRERWQEVVEEVSRTKVTKAYLATLDETVHKGTFKVLHDADIVLVTTASNCIRLREKFAKNDDVDRFIISFEELLLTLRELNQQTNIEFWPKPYIKQLYQHYQNQCVSFRGNNPINNFYQKELIRLKGLLSC